MKNIPALIFYIAVLALLPDKGLARTNERDAYLVANGRTPYWMIFVDSKRIELILASSAKGLVEGPSEKVDLPIAHSSNADGTLSLQAEGRGKAIFIQATGCEANGPCCAQGGSYGTVGVTIRYAQRTLIGCGDFLAEMPTASFR